MTSVRTWIVFPVAVLGFLAGWIVTPSHKRMNSNCAESAQVLLNEVPVKCQPGQRMERETAAEVAIYRCTCP